MAPKPIPDRWLDYAPVGDQVKGTRFIAFKVPLREGVVASVPDSIRLSCNSLIKKIPNIGLIIDLTNTQRYYNPQFFIEKGISYEKLMIPGKEIPPESAIIKFRDIVRQYLQQNHRTDKVIGVHCTHGLNRTGFLICNFMVSDLKIDPDEAIKRFEKARGHAIERENYRNFLRNLKINSDLSGGRRNSSNAISGMPSGWSKSSGISRNMNSRWGNSSNTNRHMNSEWGKNSSSSTSSGMNFGQGNSSSAMSDMNSRWRNSSRASSNMNSGWRKSSSTYTQSSEATLTYYSPRSNQPSSSLNDTRILAESEFK